MDRGALWLIRHGETEWSRTGRHTGRTNLALTARGEADAAALAPRLAGRSFACVLISPLDRAQRTAALAGLQGDADPDLLEWDYGAVEGRTTADIRSDRADSAWTIWRDPIPAGETPGEQSEQVAERAGRVLRRCEPHLLAGADCVLVAHGHLLRILTATWLGLPSVAARLFTLDAGALSTLGYEHEQPVILTWNTR